MIDAAYQFFIEPFAEFAFMQRALLGTLLLSLSASPVGVFLMLRRMSLTGDAMSHAILPGVATGFLLFGLDILPMTLGGLAAGIVVALGAGLISRVTVQREDASLAAFYLISLALGVLIISLRGSAVDLMHVLFGSVLGLNDAAMTAISIITVSSLTILAVFWRALVAECLDPLFLRSVSGFGPVVHFVFLGAVVLNLVGGYLALGTLLSVGLMMLPAAAARFWTARAETMALAAIGIAAVSSVSGLLISYHAALPAGPAIVLSAGALYFGSLVLGTSGILNSRTTKGHHRTA